MDNSQSSFDIVTVKKLVPVAVAVGVVLGILISIGIPLGGLWGPILTLAWIYCGVLYANTILKTGASSDVASLAINGALVAMIAELAYDIVTGIFMSFSYFSFSSFFSIGLFLQAGIIGALSAVVWHTIQGKK